MNLRAYSDGLGGRAIKTALVGAHTPSGCRQPDRAESAAGYRCWITRNSLIDIYGWTLKHLRCWITRLGTLTFYFSEMMVAFTVLMTAFSPKGG